MWTGLPPMGDPDREGGALGVIPPACWAPPSTENVCLPRPCPTDLACVSRWCFGALCYTPTSPLTPTSPSKKSETTEEIGDHCLPALACVCVHARGGVGW